MKNRKKRRGERKREREREMKVADRTGLMGVRPDIVTETGKSHTHQGCSTGKSAKCWVFYVRVWLCVGVWMCVCGGGGGGES